MTSTLRVLTSAVFALLVAFASNAAAQATLISFDNLPRANRDSANGTVALAKPVAARPRRPARVDTIRIVDTVRIVRVDTVHAPAPTPAAATPVQPATTPAAPNAPPPTPTLTSASIDGLLQVMLTGGDASLKSTYRIRRAEFKVTTELGRKAQAIIMIDLAKALALSTDGLGQWSVSQNSRVLQDAYVTSPVWHTQLDAGQQRLALGLEGSSSASGLETVERALMESSRSRGASFGDVRDLGVAARGSWHALDYKGGVFNGSGETMNDADKNVGKALVAQLGWRVPFIHGLRIGGSGATSGSPTGDKPVRDRAGVDVRYTHGPALLQGELMAGRDANLPRQGMYLLGAYAVVPSLKLVARFDSWDPDLHHEATPADVAERDYLLGFTWLPSATRLKLQFNVVRKGYTHSITPWATMALTQLQASW